MSSTSCSQVSSSCRHSYGIWDSESSVIGRNIWVHDKGSELYRDGEEFEPFLYCPYCGTKLVTDKEEIYFNFHGTLPS